MLRAFAVVRILPKVLIMFLQSFYNVIANAWRLLINVLIRFFGGGGSTEEEEKVVKGDDVIVELEATLEDLYMGGSMKVCYPPSKDVIIVFNSYTWAHEIYLPSPFGLLMMDVPR